MIIYIRTMRTKDEFKQEALFKATVKLVNEIGFVSSSVAKIAKEAGISPATIYIYYKNKEDLLVCTYVNIKRNLSKAMLENFHSSLPIRDILRNAWFNMFRHITKYPDYFQFTEQFANSPYSALVNSLDVDKYFEPIINVLQRGIEQKIIKPVDFDILFAFAFYPIITLANPRLCDNFEVNEKNIETAFTMAWDAIKL
ncbi:TetR/AcrR family transcriptional regulator [candidate division KSB1 bacterium]|nr:TetR/AcrR family transcriptional regulator [candidate division KSB1 bacterium]